MSNQQTREEIERLREQLPEVECGYCYRKLPRLTRNSEGLYVLAQRPYAPFCRLRCALDFARGAYAAGHRVMNKGETEVRKP